MLKKTLVLAAILGVVLSLGACGGGSSSSSASGRVVKGPVYGASVYDSTGVLVGTTDVNGYFPLSGTGPYRTVGGTYVPLNASGAAGSSALPAPPMSAPAGVNQLTPLSTLVANAGAADRTAILATLTKLGVTLNSDFSIKNSSNASAIALNEMIGAVLQIDVSTATINSLITAVADLATSTPPISITTVTTAVTSAAGLSGAQITAANIASQGVTNRTDGALPIVSLTGSSGGAL